VATFDFLQRTFQELISQELPPLLELRKAFLEFEEFLVTSEYSDLPAETREQIQNMRRDLRARIRTLENWDAISGESSFESTSGGFSNDQSNHPQAPQARARDPQSERMMEDAEKLFYGGRYGEAIKLFDQVLQVDPNWERARQHRAESENYLRTGYIPPVALPAEAASAFGKAQSAARVGRYEDAMSMLSKAQIVLRDLGIQRWQEGLEFEQKLQENIDAEYAYNEGLLEFEQGKIDEAIERIETAARTTGLPKYNDRALAFRKVKEIIRSNNEVLSSPNIDPKVVTQAKTDLDILVGEYGENPAFQRLKARLESAIPRAVSPLKDQARALKAQAVRAATIDETLYLASQAKNQLDQIRNLAGLDESLDHLQDEVDKLLLDITRLQDELTQAGILYANNKRWPSQAAKLSLEARLRFPNDPQVIRFNRSLSTFFILRGFFQLGIGLLVIAALVGLAWYAIGRARQYVISLTPTSSPTFTRTATSSPTPTFTASPTISPMPTSTPTPTPTPTIAVAMRDIWARSGCYEGYNAIGRIPTGGYLRFLQDERRFDQFIRECVLVEYQGPERSTIGWVLIMDLGRALITPTP